MKTTTHIIMCCQNIGKPKEQQVFEGSMRDVGLQFISWMAQINMAKSIRVEIVRHKHELGGTGSKLDFTAEFDQLFDEIMTQQTQINGAAE